MDSIKKIEGRKKAFFEAVYLTLLAVTVLISFLDTTMIPIQWPEKLPFFLQLLTVLVVLTKLAADSPWSLKDLVLFLAACVGMIGGWLRWDRDYLLELVVLIAGARGISSRKIVKVYLAVCLPALLVTMLLALVGVIENLVYYQAAHAYRPRISFGIIYPTDFSAHVFFLTACYAWLRERRITYWEIGGIALLAAFVLYFCDAKMNTICLLLLAGGLLYIKLRRQLARKQGQEYHMHRGVQWLLCVAAPVCAVVIILLSCLYRDSGLLSALNKILNNRLYYGHQGFTDYRVPWFGQYVAMQGSGGSTDSVGSAYFYLDSSYVNILLRMGLTVFTGVLLIQVIGGLREAENGSWERLGILAVIAAQCVVEHHLLDLSYHPFLLLLLAVPAAESPAPLSGRGNSSIERKENGSMKICLVGSSGGHLTHLYMLKPFWQDKERFWVTFDKADAKSILQNEKMYPCYYPTNRNIKNLVRNTVVAWKTLRKEKPDLIISSGAAVAVPFFYLGKLMGAKLIYIEVFDRIDKPTMTGKLVYPIADQFIVQWEEMKQVYPKAVNLGSIF